MRTLLESTTAPPRSTTSTATGTNQSRPFREAYTDEMRRPERNPLFDWMQGIFGDQGGGGTDNRQRQPKAPDTLLDQSHFERRENQPQEQWNSTGIRALDQVQNLAQQRQSNPRTAPTLRQDVLLDQVRQESNRMTEPTLAQTIENIARPIDSYSQIPEEIRRTIDVLRHNRNRYTRDEIVEERRKAIEIIEMYTNMFYENKYAANAPDPVLTRP